MNIITYIWLFFSIVNIIFGVLNHSIETSLGWFSSSLAIIIILLKG